MELKQPEDIYQPEFFKLLSDCYILPDGNLKESVSSLMYLTKKAHPHLEEQAEIMLSVMEQGDNLEDLQVDFTKLFIGPYTMLAPPYESIYRSGEGAMMGNSTMDIFQLYNESGLDLAEDYHDAPDHVATELEFLYVLLAKAISDSIRNDIETSKRVEESLRVLLVDHLRQWIPELTNRIEEKAESEFYKALARITRDVIAKTSDSYF